MLKVHKKYVSSNFQLLESTHFHNQIDLTIAMCKYVRRIAIKLLNLGFKMDVGSTLETINPHFWL